MRLKRVLFFASNVMNNHAYDCFKIDCYAAKKKNQSILKSFNIGCKVAMFLTSISKFKFFFVIQTVY